MKTIDITPTWSEILPTLLAVMRDATPEGKALAIEELQRMARAADLWNTAAKNRSGPGWRRIWRSPRRGR